MLWCISKLLLSLSPCQNSKGSFLWPLPGSHNLVELKRQNLQKDRGFPGVFTSQIFPHKPPAIRQIQFRFSYLTIGVHRDFCSWVSVPVGCYSLYLPSASPILGTVIFSCDLTSLMNLRRTVDFSVCSDIYLLGQSGNFQAPSMLDSKLDVS